MAEVRFLDAAIDEAVITVRPRRFIFWRSRPHQYRGSGTVWHDAETGRRCSTSRELALCNIWTRARWTVQDALSATLQEPQP